MKSEETKSPMKALLLYLTNSYFYKYKPSPRILRQYRVLGNLRKNKNIIIKKLGKGNGVALLDRKLYDNATQEIISETSKFEDATLKREASLRLFLRNLKHENVFNENVCDKIFPSCSAPARSYGTLKMHKISSRDTFPKLRPIVSSIDIFNYNLAIFFAIFFHLST